jgi:hypothetical protein
VAGKPFEVKLEGLRVALGIGHGFARGCFDQNSASVMPVHPQNLNSAKWQRPSILRWAAGDNLRLARAQAVFAQLVVASRMHTV